MRSTKLSERRSYCIGFNKFIEIEIITAVAAEGATGADPVVAGRIVVEAARITTIGVDIVRASPEEVDHTVVKVVTTHTAGVGTSLVGPTVVDHIAVVANHTVEEGIDPVGLEVVDHTVEEAEHTVVGEHISLADPGEVDHTGQASRTTVGADRIITVGVDIIRASPEVVDHTVVKVVTTHTAGVDTNLATRIVEAAGHIVGEGTDHVAGEGIGQVAGQDTVQAAGEDIIQASRIVVA